jgi:hypothetical protein
MDKASDSIRAKVAELGPSFLPAIRPLAVPNDLGDELIPAGSAVLVSRRNERYVFTAAHVTELYPDRAYHIGTMRRWLELEGPWIVSPAPNGDREADIVDGAFRHVTPEFADTLDGCSFLREDQQSLVEQVNFVPPHRSKYVAMGYPLNAFKYRRYSRTTVPQTLSYIGNIASPQSYVEQKLPVNANLALDFEWDAIVGDNGLQQSPKLEGISGGAIIRVPSLETPAKNDPPPLVAITIEQRRQARVIVGTRLGMFYSAIDAQP